MMMIPILLLMATTIPSVEQATPSRQPQLAAAHGMVAMTFGSGSKIYFASSPDQGSAGTLR